MSSTPAVPADSDTAVILKRPKEASCVKFTANALHFASNEKLFGAYFAWKHFSACEQCYFCRRQSVER